MVKQISASETLDLRHRVLRPNQNRLSCIYPLDGSTQSAHFGFFSQDELVSIASVYLESHTDGTKQAWRLRGMATDPAHEGRGYGSKALGACIEFVRSQGGTELWCNARTTASPFYFRFGFENLSPSAFEIPEIGPHYLLSLRLST